MADLFRHPQALAESNRVGRDPADASGLYRVLASRGFLAGSLVVAAGLRLWHALSIRDLPLFDRLIIDSEVYDAWARHIAEGDWLSRVLERPFYMDPLYPYFLGSIYWLVGRDLLLVRLIQIGFGVGTCALVAVIGRRFSTAAAGNLGAWILALYRPAIFQDVEFEKTAVGVFLATASLALFLGSSIASRFGSGAALALAALARGNVLLAAPFALGQLFLRREWKPAAAFTFGMALVLAPVTWRNVHVSGEWVLTTAGAGQVFYTGNNPANADGGHHSVPFVRPQAAHEEGDFLAEAERRLGRAVSAREASTFWFQEGLRHIRESPGFAARVALRKVGLFWSDVEIPDAWDPTFVSRFSLPLRLPLVSFWLLLLLAVPGVITAWRSREGRVVLGYVAVYSASVVLFFVFSRYRLHVVPPLAALGGAALVWLVEAVRGAKWAHLGVALGAALALASYSGLSFASRGTQVTSNLAMLAEMYQERQDVERARALLEEGLRLAPNDANVLCAVGKLRLRSGNPSSANDYLNRCLRSNPVYPDGWYLLGLSLESSGDRLRAADAYRRQVGLVPGHETARARLRQLLSEAR